MLYKKQLKFYCEECGKTMDIYICCGKEMEPQKDILYCTICGMERPYSECCGRRMTVKEVKVPVI